MKYMGKKQRHSSLRSMEPSDYHLTIAADPATTTWDGLEQYLKKVIPQEGTGTVSWMKLLSGLEEAMRFQCCIAQCPSSQLVRMVHLVCTRLRVLESGGKKLFVKTAYLLHYHEGLLDSCARVCGNLPVQTRLWLWELVCKKAMHDNKDPLDKYGMWFYFAPDAEEYKLIFLRKCKKVLLCICRVRNKVNPAWQIVLKHMPEAMVQELVDGLLDKAYHYEWDVILPCLRTTLYRSRMEKARFSVWRVAWLSAVCRSVARSSRRGKSTCITYCAWDTPSMYYVWDGPSMDLSLWLGRVARHLNMLDVVFMRKLACDHRTEYDTLQMLEGMCTVLRRIEHVLDKSHRKAFLNKYCAWWFTLPTVCVPARHVFGVWRMQLWKHVKYMLRNRTSTASSVLSSFASVMHVFYDREDLLLPSMSRWIAVYLWAVGPSHVMHSCVKSRLRPMDLVPCF